MQEPMPGTAANPATSTSRSSGSSRFSTSLGSPAVLQRDAAHQPSPKTDALVDQLLTGVVGNQLKEAPGGCGHVRAEPMLCCLFTWPHELHDGCFSQYLLEDPGEVC